MKHQKLEFGEVKVERAKISNTPPKTIRRPLVKTGLKGGLYLRRGSQIFMKFFSWLQDVILRWQGGSVSALLVSSFFEKSAKVEKWHIFDELEVDPKIVFSTCCGASENLHDVN